MPTHTEFWTDADVIHAYTAEDAVEDGVLFDARKLDGEAGKMTRDRYNGSPVYLTAGLHALIQRAVDHPRHCNDWPGVWWDVLWMSTAAVNRAAVEAKEQGSGYGQFAVIITGTGRRTHHTICVALSGDGLTFMLPGER